MLEITIPGFGNVRIENLILDYNGTIAKDGRLIEGVAERLSKLAKTMTIYCITADTFGTVVSELEGLPIQVKTITKGQEVQDKLDFINELSPESTAAMGNGSNDELMLKSSRIGICLIGSEGCSTKALVNADVVCSHILDALDLFIYPNRLKATLRF